MQITDPVRPCHFSVTPEIEIHACRTDHSNQRDGAFLDCIGLTRVILKGASASIGEEAFYEDPDMAVTFLVPAASVAYYQGKLSPGVMGETAAIVVGEKDVTAIFGLPAAKTVANGTALKDLNLPSSLTLTIDGAPETVDVAWASTPTYDPDQAGTYLFTPILPAEEGYVLADGVSAAVSVTVSPESSGSHHPSSSASTPSFPPAATGSLTGAAADLSGAAFPSSVTGVSLSVTPETANGNLITSFTGSVTVRIPVPAGIHGTPHVFRYEESTGTVWIAFDVYDNKNKLLTHVSTRVDVRTGIRPRGDSTRQTGVIA